jgi:hypothetical protein
MQFLELFASLWRNANYFSHAIVKMIVKCKELLSTNYLALLGEASTQLLQERDVIETT